MLKGVSAFGRVCFLQEINSATQCLVQALPAPLTTIAATVAGSRSISSAVHSIVAVAAKATAGNNSNG